jgi:hypothetical protein
MKTQTFYKLLIGILLFNTACSNNDGGDLCPNWYYVYTYDDCECSEDDDLCKTYHLINKEIYECLKNALDKSNESCLIIDNTVCSEINFSGLIREVVADCLELDWF